MEKKELGWALNSCSMASEVDVLELNEYLVEEIRPGNDRNFGTPVQDARGGFDVFENFSDSLIVGGRCV